MEKASALRLGFSAILLASIGYGATLHAHDGTLPTHPPAASTPVAKQADLDLVGVVGDVMVDGCGAGDARCSKAWKDLGKLAGKDAL